MINIQEIRSQFPILKTLVRGKPLVYLDNAATTQKPQSVIDSLVRYYTSLNSNVHRGVHYLSNLASEEFENSRKTIQRFINAEKESEIIFTRGATESINLVASSYGRAFFKKGDEVIISTMEHHSNIVPWQMLESELGIKLKVIPISDEGELIIEEFEKLLSEKTKFVSIVYISNSLGTINPIKKIIKKAHSFAVPVLIDAAQAIHHKKIDVKELDCDFLAFSGHKMYGPTGIGVLYGKKKFLEQMPPYQAGGDMIKSVRFERTIFNDIPFKFEAGTPDISGGIALAEAIRFIESIGYDEIESYETELLDYATEKVSEIPELQIIGRAKEKSAVLSFVIEGIHPHDIGTFLDVDGIAIRTGHHCTEPIMQRFAIPATSRASFAIYNKKEEIDLLTQSIKKVIQLFK